MWARQIELCLGFWLVLSPFIFRHGGSQAPSPAPATLWTIDLVCGGATVLLALVCHWHPARRAHLIHLLVAAFLIVAGWLGVHQEGMTAGDGAGAGTGAGAHQNHIIVGLLLATFAVVPSHAQRPPDAWSRFYQEVGSK